MKMELGLYHRDELKSKKDRTDERREQKCLKARGTKWRQVGRAESSDTQSLRELWDQVMMSQLIPVTA